MLNLLTRTQNSIQKQLLLLLTLIILRGRPVVILFSHTLTGNYIEENT